MNILKLFIITRNDYDIIEEFIIYHSKIVGFENIIIIDLKSDNKIVLEIYNKYKDKLIIFYENDNLEKMKQIDYYNKYMNMYKNEADFLWALEVREFIYLANEENSKIIRDPEIIKDYLNNLSLEYDYFKILNYDWSIPNTNSPDYNNYKHHHPINSITSFIRTQYKDKLNGQSKTFYRASNFINTWLDNSSGTTINNKRYVTNFGLFNFYYTGKQRCIERAINMCLSYNYIKKDESKEVIIAKLEKLVFENKLVGSIYIKELYYHLKREYIIFLFLIFIKRYPELDELNTHTFDKILLNNKKLIFINCSEKKANDNDMSIFPDINKINDLLNSETIKLIDNDNIHQIGIYDITEYSE